MVPPRAYAPGMYAPTDGVNKERNDERGADGAAQVDAGQHEDALPGRAEVLRLEGGGEDAGGVGGLRQLLLLLLRPFHDLGGAVG